MRGYLSVSSHRAVYCRIVLYCRRQDKCINICLRVLRHFRSWPRDDATGIATNPRGASQSCSPANFVAWTRIHRPRLHGLEARGPDHRRRLVNRIVRLLVLDLGCQKVPHLDTRLAQVTHPDWAVLVHMKLYNIANGHSFRECL